MNVLKNGFFSLPISSDKISKGLRAEKNNPVNKHSMIVCSGVIGKDGVLERIQEQLRAFSVETEFPYPQIFVETNLVIVCTRDSIYEFTNNDLELRLTTTVGSPWSLISVHDFVYMSNGIVSVVRDPESKVFELSETLPTAMAICNYNGQVIIGAPNAGYNLGDT